MENEKVKSDKDEVKFYYLIAGDVTYHLINKPETAVTTSHNAIISGLEQGLSPVDLYTAVKGLEQAVKNTYDNVEVDYATILNMIPLGYHKINEWDEAKKQLNN